MVQIPEITPIHPGALEQKMVRQGLNKNEDEVARRNLMLRWEMS